MRTTIRIDDDLMAELRERSSRENVSFTGLVNSLIRRGLEAVRDAGRPRRRYREKSFSMGEAAIDLRKALAIAFEMEDEETLRKISLRK